MASISQHDFMRLQFACDTSASLNFMFREVEQKFNTIFQRLDLIENKINDCVSIINKIEEHLKTDHTKINSLGKDVSSLIDKDFEETINDFSTKHLIQEQERLRYQIKEQDKKINELINLLQKE